MVKILALLLALVSPAYAQQNLDLTNLPLQTVVGNPSTVPGPASAITISQLQSLLSVTCATATTLSLGCVKPDGTSITISAGVISAAVGGSGCTISGGSQFNIIVNNGSGGCTSAANASANAGQLTLGGSGTVGQIVLGNATSGTLTLKTVTGALGSPIVSLPAVTDTLVGKTTSDVFTNKTLAATTNVIGGVTMTLGSDATGDIYYRNSASHLTRLGLGTANQVLTVSGGLPSWQNSAAGSGLTVGTTTVASGTTTRILYDNAGVLGEYTLTGTGTVVAMQAGPTFTGTANFTTLTTPQITLGGNVSQAAWTTNGVQLVHGTSTLTDTTSSGTVAAAYTNTLNGNTIASSSTTTYTDYFGTFIVGPVAGSNVTFTRMWALGANANVQFPLLQLGIPSSATGSLVLANSSSANLTTIQAGNAAAARTYVWPTNFGAAGSILTDAAGNGVLSWSTSAATVSSVTAANGTLTISPTSGAVVAGLNLGNSNTWTVAQTISPSLTLGVGSSATGQLILLNGSNTNTTTIQAGTAAASKVYTWPTNFGSPGTVLTDAAGNGTLSWAASGATVASVSNSDGTLTISPTTGAVVASLALGHSNTWTAAQTFTSATWTGSLTEKVRSSAASTVTVSATTDYFLCLDPTSNAIAANLPGSPATGLTYLIKDCTGQAAAHNITVTPAAGNIDGAGTFVMSTAYQSIAVTYTGSQWSIN